MRKLCVAYFTFLGKWLHNRGTLLIFTGPINVCKMKCCIYGWQLRMAVAAEHIHPIGAKSPGPTAISGGAGLWKEKRDHS